jgi:hypothetical protein
MDFRETLSPQPDYWTKSYPTLNKDLNTDPRFYHCHRKAGEVRATASRVGLSRLRYLLLTCFCVHVTAIASCSVRPDFEKRPEHIETETSTGRAVWGKCMIAAR